MENKEYNEHKKSKKIDLLLFVILMLGVLYFVFGRKKEEVKLEKTDEEKNEEEAFSKMIKMASITVSGVTEIKYEPLSGTRYFLLLKKKNFDVFDFSLSAYVLDPLPKNIVGNNDTRIIEFDTSFVNDNYYIRIIYPKNAGITYKKINILGARSFNFYIPSYALKKIVDGVYRIDFEIYRKP